MTMKVIILTGSQLRHDYFRIRLALNEEFEVLASFCEKNDRASLHLTEQDPLSLEHLRIREVSEQDFFEDFVMYSKDNSRPELVELGGVNNSEIVEKINKLNPDLIISYGCSIIKGELLTKFKGRFINLHLGLSPYYRGCATNFWPFVNGEPEYCGVTFMHIDEGVDTGKVIHQIQADFGITDHPVNIGNRLIKKMTKVCAELIIKFHELKPMHTYSSDKELLYKNKDLNDGAVIQYYKNFAMNIERLCDENGPSIKQEVKLVKQKVMVAE